MQTDAPVLCATSQDGTARLANVATGKILVTLSHQHAQKAVSGSAAAIAAATEGEETTSVET
jgi:hypothetical protein